MSFGLVPSCYCLSLGVMWLKLSWPLGLGYRCLTGLLTILYIFLVAALPVSLIDS